MSYSAIIEDDRFELALTHSREGGSKAAQIVDMMGGHRNRHLDMKGAGTKAKANDLGLYALLGSRKALIITGTARNNEDLRDRNNDLTSNGTSSLRLDLKMMREMGASIADVPELLEAVIELQDTALTDAAIVTEFEALITDVADLKRLENMTEISPDLRETIKLRIESLSKEITARLEAVLEQVALSPVLALELRGVLGAALKTTVAAIFSIVETTARNVGLTQLVEHVQSVQAELIATIDDLVKPEIKEQGISLGELALLPVGLIQSQISALLNDDNLSADHRELLEALSQELQQFESHEIIPTDIATKLATLTENSGLNLAVTVEQFTVKIGRSITASNLVSELITQLETADLSAPERVKVIELTTEVSSRFINGDAPVTPDIEAKIVELVAETGLSISLNNVSPKKIELVAQAIINTQSEPALDPGIRGAVTAAVQNFIEPIYTRVENGIIQPVTLSDVTEQIKFVTTEVSNALSETAAPVEVSNLVETLETVSNDIVNGAAGAEPINDDVVPETPDAIVVEGVVDDIISGPENIVETQTDIDTKSESKGDSDLKNPDDPETHKDDCGCGQCGKDFNDAAGGGVRPEILKATAEKAGISVEKVMQIQKDSAAIEALLSKPDDNGGDAAARKAERDRARDARARGGEGIGHVHSENCGCSQAFNAPEDGSQDDAVTTPAAIGEGAEAKRHVAADQGPVKNLTI